MEEIKRCQKEEDIKVLRTIRTTGEINEQDTRDRAKIKK